MRSKAILIIITFLFSTNHLLSSSISGKVLDPNGFPVPYANVFIEDLKTGSTTNYEGKFIISNVPKGQHTIKASHISFVTVELLVNSPSNDVIISFEQEAVTSSDAVVVTATRTPTTLKESPLPVTLIAKESIEEIQAVTLSDAIEHIPGIVLMPNGFTRYSATIHGLPEEYSLLMVDGQRVYGRHADAKDFDHIPVGMIERVELVKGPSSVLYGSDAIAGVINVITKSGLNTPYYELYGFAGSDEQYSTRINAGGKLGGISNFISATYTKCGQMAEGYGFSNLNIRYNGRYNPSKRSEFRIGGGYFSEETEDMPAVDGHEEGGPYLSDDVYDLNIGYHYETESNSSYDFSAYVFKQDRWDNRPGRTDRTWDRNHYRVEGMAQYNWNPQELVFGIEGRNESLEHTQIQGTKNQYLLSMFVQDTWTLIESMSLVAAARIENHDKWGLVFTPRLGIAFHIPNLFNIRLSGGTSFRAPSLENLYLESYFHPWGGGFWLGGNPDLKPEKGLGGNLDIEWIPNPKAVLTVGLYYNKLTDRIASVDTDKEINGSPVREQINSEKAESYGIDVQFNWIFFPGWKLGLSYGYIHSEDKTKGKPFDMTPYNKAGLNLNWKQREWGTTFNLNFTNIGERYNSNEILEEAYILDINMEQKIFGGISGFIAVDNLLDEDLYPSKYINYGRFYRVGIRIRK